jgi:hypothetical protein
MEHGLCPVADDGMVLRAIDGEPVSQSREVVSLCPSPSVSLFIPGSLIPRSLPYAWS